MGRLLLFDGVFSFDLSSHVLEDHREALLPIDTPFNLLFRHHPHATPREPMIRIGAACGGEPLLVAAVLILATIAGCNATGCLCAHRRPVFEVLYSATNGPNWLRPWNMNGDVPCSLEGVNCSAKVGDVVAITLAARNLVGTLPKILGELHQLTGFAVQNNTLTGTVPESFSNWTHLRHFDISINQFSGPLPCAFSAWSDVNMIIARNNQLNGTLCAAYSSWVALTHFEIPDNSWIGTLPPSYTAWRAIIRFEVSGNSISGTLPSSFSAWANLSYFAVSSNSINGTLPASYAAWVRLDRFSAFHNQISGTLPPEYQAWVLMERFDVGGNLLVGSIPASFSAWGNIDYFSVETNNISGTLPSSLSAWAKVDFVSFASNNISGTLPASYASWVGLTNFSACFNRLAGTLPPEYSAWASVRFFLVEANTLAGSLPPAYASMAKMHTFVAHANQLIGSLPPQYASWSSVDTISLFSNSLEGTIPSVWGTSMTVLSRCLLNRNLLTGVIPASLLTLSTLRYFSASFNNLRGTLPSGAGGTAAPTLLFLDVQNNSGIEGKLPSQLWPFSVVTLCGTDICVSFPSLLSQYCIPVNEQIPQTVDADAILQMWSPYKYTCTSHRGPTDLPHSYTASLPVDHHLLPENSQARKSTLLVASSVALTSVIYASPFAGGVGSGGAVQGVQRASLVLRLARFCSSDPADAGDDSLEVQDNIWLLSIPVGSTEAINSAAGAAVGNAAFVVLIAVLLHVCGTLQARRLEGAARLLKLLPSSRLPGALAVPFGMLAQPSIAACITLMASEERRVGSVALGATMMLIWLSVPAYVARALLFRGRQHGLFLLATRTTPPPPLRRRRERPSRYLQQIVATLCTAWMAPSGEWTSNPAVRSYEGRQHARFLLDNMAPVYDSFVQHREWFFIVECGIGLMSGVALGTANALAGNAGAMTAACTAARWGMWCAAAVGALEVFCYVLLRPFSVRFEFAAAVATSGLALASVALVLGGKDAAAEAVVLCGCTVELLALMWMVLYNVLTNGRLRANRCDVRCPTGGDLSSPVSVRRLKPVLSLKPPAHSTTREERLEQLVELACSSSGQRREAVAISPTLEERLVSREMPKPLVQQSKKRTTAPRR